MKIAIITDIHEDIITLKKCIISFEKLSCDIIVCLGDIVGYSKSYYDYIDTRDAEECVNIIKRNCDIVTIGNHDLNAIGKLPVYKANTKYPEYWFELSTFQKRNLLASKVWLYEDESPHNLSPKNIEYLNSLKEYEILKLEETNILFSHFIYPNFTGSNRKFPFFERDMNKHFNFISENNCACSIFGHLHPFQPLISSKSKFSLLSFFNSAFKNVMVEIQQINTSQKTAYSIPSLTNNKYNNKLAILDTKNMTLIFR